MSARVELLLWVDLAILGVVLLVDLARAQEPTTCPELGAPWLVHVESGRGVAWEPASGPVVGYRVYRAGEAEPVITVPGAKLPDACAVLGVAEASIEVAGIDEFGNEGPRSCPSDPIRCGCYPDANCDDAVTSVPDFTSFACAFTGWCRVPTWQPPTP